MDSVEPRSSTRLSLLSLPSELRDMIYTLVLWKTCNIMVRSPHSKAGDRESCRLRGQPYHSPRLIRCAIVLANKQIYSEATRVLYAVNITNIGNGEYGSRSQPNIHGLKAFLRRLPADNLVFIKNLDLEPHLGSRQWFENDETSDWDEEWAQMYGETRHGSDDEKELETIARILARKFTGLQNVRIILPYVTRADFKLPILPDSYNLRVVKGVVQLLMKIGSIRLIQLVGYGNHDEIAEKILDVLLETNPDAAEVVEVRY